MINSQFCQKLKTRPQTTTLYNSQIGAIYFVCFTVFRISSLPSFVSSKASSETLLVYVIMLSLDLVLFALSYTYFSVGADEKFKDKPSTFYKIFLVFLAVYFAFKLTLYFSLASLFITAELFTGISPWIVVFILLIPVVYIGAKGAKNIARIAELSFVVIAVIIAFNLIFLKTNLDVRRNLPLDALSAKEFFDASFSHGVWLGDFFPLLFIRQTNKKLPFIPISAGISTLLVLIIVFLGVSLYGNALEYTSNVLIRIAGFNQLSTEIGRMEWMPLFAILIMGILEMSFLLYGIGECSARLFKSKYVLLCAMAIIIFALSLALPSQQQIVDLARTNATGYIFTVLSSFIALASFILSKTTKSKKDKENG